MTSMIVLWKVSVAALANFLLGVLWYSPLLFGPDWKKAAKKSGLKTRIDPWAAHATTFLTLCLATYALAVIIRAAGATNATDGAIIGLAVGLAFIATQMLSDALYTGQSVTLFLINTSYRVLGLALSGAILASWR